MSSHGAIRAALCSILASVALHAQLLPGAGQGRSRPGGRPAMREPAPAPKPPEAPAVQVRVRPAPREAPGPDLSLGIKFAPLQGAPAPAVDSFTLPCGLRVRLLANRELPVVNGSLLVRGGTSSDPAEKFGLAEIAARVVAGGGTAEMTPEAVALRLEQLGASIGSDAQPEASLVRFSGLSENFPALLRIFAELVQRPSLDNDTFETLHGRARGQVAFQYNDPTRTVAMELSRALYGASHPLGRRIGYDDLDNIGPEDMAAFHRKYFTPANAVLSIEGDFDAAQTRGELEKLFANWKGAAPQPAPSPKPESKPGVYYVERRDLNRAVLAMGQIAPLSTDEDIAAALILMEALGNRENGRLGEMSTNHRLWEMDMRASWGADGAGQGVFVLQGTVGSAYVTDAIAEVTAAAAKLRTELLSQREVEQAILRWTTASALRSSRPGALLGVMAGNEILELPADRLFNVQKAVLAVTPASVRRVASERLDPSKFAIVVAGSETLFDRPLSELRREVSPADLTIPPSKPFQPRTDAASLEQGKVWLEKMRKALGGAEALAAVRAYSLRLEGTIYAPATTMNGVRTDRWFAEEQRQAIRQDMELATGEQSVFYNGEIGWLAQNRRIGPLPVPMLLQVRSELFRVPFRLALSDRIADRTVCHLGANIVQVTDKAGNGVKIYIDPETGLPQRMSYKLESANRASVSVEEILTDWKPAGGVMVPGKIRVKQNGRRTEEFKLVDAKVNDGVTLAEMEKKP